jgi:hypothetical protein
MDYVLNLFQCFLACNFFLAWVGTHAVRWGIFDIWDHLHQWNDKRDHLWNYLLKRTLTEWRHPWPGDTWHVPPGPVPASSCCRWHFRQVAVRTLPLAAVRLGGPCCLWGCRQADMAPCRQRHRRHAATPRPALIPMITALTPRRGWFIACDDR